MSMLQLFLAFATAADDWPHWRGPARTGISAESAWTDRWPAAGPPVLWTAEVGIGFSSFAVAAGRVLTLGHADEKDIVVCLDAATGKTVWSHAYPSELGDKFFEGGTTSTPTVDGDRVFTLGRWGDLICFDVATGKIAWSKNLTQETGAPPPGWGFSGSPLVHGGLLILNAGEAGIAVDKATGKVAWTSAAKESGYSTPFPVRRGGATEILLGSAKSYLAVEPATGKELWRVRWPTSYGCNAADPIVDGDRLFLSTGYDKGCALFALGEGEPKPVWQGKVLRNQMNPSVLIDGHLYGLDGDTTHKRAIKCVELATGTVKWTHEGLGTASVAAAAGKLIVLGDGGDLVVAPATPEKFKITAHAKVIDGKCWTVPVLANGRILVRNAEGKIVCLDVTPR